jgi:hypothetical protein
MTPAIEAIMQWALHQSSTHVLVTSRFEYSKIATATFKWEPKGQDHTFHLTPHMMQLSDTRHPRGYASDKQLFMSIAYKEQEFEVGVVCVHTGVCILTYMLAHTYQYALLYS